MFRNYLTVALRNLGRNKVYAGINIAGLALGLATALLLLLWVQDELSYDRFHRNAPSIYRVVAHIGTGGNRQTWENTQGPVATYALKEVPGVQNAARVARTYDMTLFTHGNNTFTESNNAYVDPAFFSLFDFGLVKGDPRKPFPDKHAVVLTESMARKYFGTGEPLGKVIQVDQKDNFTVSGVIKDLPANSSIRFDFFFSIDLMKEKQYPPGSYWKSLDNDWGNYKLTSYLLLQPGTSLEAVAGKLSHILHTHHPNYKDSGATVMYALQPLADVHLYAPDGTENGAQTVRIFLVVAMVVLVIACINYVNLSTAQAMQRAREVGVRKVIGANRGQLFAQFLGESALVFVIALVLAIGIMHALMPLYNELSGKTMTLNLFRPQTALTLVGALGVTLLLAGIYPTLLLSSFQPLQVMKGKLSAGHSGASFRRVLVVLQFAVSVVLIVGTLVMKGQLQYIREKQLGYDRENVFSFGMRGEMGGRFESIRNELLRQTGVMGVTRAGGNLLEIDNTTSDTDWDGKDAQHMVMIHPMAVDEALLETFRMPLAAGKGFTGSKADSTHFILNETAVRETGIKDPVGKRFKLWDTEGTIIGVVRDFHFTSMRQKIEPAVFFYQPEWCWNVYVKTTGRDAPKAIAAAEKLWKTFNPAYPFEYHFMDDSYDRMYRADQRTGTLFDCFAAVAILISCLGLFGLATHTAQRRVKEIGIRKVLGASAADLVALLSKEFIRLVAIAFLLASPVAWYAMNQWLQKFAYREEIAWWIFVLAGGLAVLIAVLTVGLQSVKAALANPVKSLRSE
jgi:putative ABC transport system permease protein